MLINLINLNKMKEQQSHILEAENLNFLIEQMKNEKRYIYNYNFDIKYETLNPIIKDIQMISQLIQSIKDHQINDLIYITGNSSSTINSRFFFNYRKIIDFYVNVLYFEETENLLKIIYHVYKTKPVCKKFIIIFSLIKIEKKAKLEIEILPGKNIIIPEKILNVINNEFDYNFLYLSLAIKLKKEKSIFFNSEIIHNNFFILSQIIQNVKLMEYLINRKIINMTDNNNNEESLKLNRRNNYVQLNEKYKINLEKKKNISINDIYFKVIYFKSKEDKLIIKLKLLPENKDQENNINSNIFLYNIIALNIFKITKNSTFIFIKCILDSNYNETKINSIKKGFKKIFCRIKKLSEISKNNNFFES